MDKKKDTPAEVETVTVTMSRPVAEAVQAACVERETLIFRSKMSTVDNFVCDACHNAGQVIELTIPETKYFDGRKLTTRYFEFWLSMDCRERLIRALTKEG